MLQTLLPAAPLLVAAPSPDKLLLWGIVVAFVILSLSIHEVAHGWVALKCGDPTARDLGRLTLNPAAHIDPFMTILVPIALLAAGLPAFGGAKPVPVNAPLLRHPLRDMALVAIAGPLSNVVLAVLFAVLLRLALAFEYAPSSLLVQSLVMTIQLNLVLAVFNMIPIPPLDGSRVMAWLLPSHLRETYVSFERFGLVLVLVLVLTGAFVALLETTVFPLYDFLIRTVVLT